MSELIYVAKLGKTVGLKGQLKLYIDSDFPQQFKAGAVFTTNKKLTLQIEHYNAKSETVKFVGIDDIDAARRVVTQQLYTSIEQTKDGCVLQKNQYFWFDLIGCNVVEDTKQLGSIKDIHRYPVDDYFEVLTSKEYLDKDLPKTFLIPYNDTFIKDVDLETKTVYTCGAFDILENS